MAQPALTGESQGGAAGRSIENERPLNGSQALPGARIIIASYCVRRWSPSSQAALESFASSFSMRFRCIGLGEIARDGEHLPLERTRFARHEFQSPVFRGRRGGWCPKPGLRSAGSERCAAGGSRAALGPPSADIPKSSWSASVSAANARSTANARVDIELFPHSCNGRAMVRPGSMVSARERHI